MHGLNILPLLALIGRSENLIQAMSDLAVMIAEVCKKDKNVNKLPPTRLEWGFLGVREFRALRVTPARRLAMNFGKISFLQSCRVLLRLITKKAPSYCKKE